MYLPAKSERGPSTALLLITIIVTGICLLSYFSVQQFNDNSRRQLAERATTIAAALDTDTIASLSGDESDLLKPVYAELKSKLLAIKQINTDARSVYLTGSRGGEVYFMVDSEAPDSQYFSPPGEVYPEATELFKNMFYSSPIPAVEGPVSDKFGSWVSGLAPITDRHGKVIAVVGIDVDAVTFYNSLLGALTLPLGGGLILVAVVASYEWIRRRDQQLLRLRSELVSIASHELRSPLVGIRWAIEAYMKKNPQTDAADMLHAIYDSVVHLQSGTDDILQFTSFTQKGLGQLKIVPTDVRALLTEICDAQRLVAEQKGVHLVVDDTWPDGLMIDCDPDRIKRALHNLVSNAIKYTRSNTDVIVRYERSPREHHISVIDHGIGIPKHEQGRVFAGFYRATNAKATGIGGTGLGLYLTRVIVAQHKGHITFFSREGKGTAFVMTLPARKVIKPQ